MHWKILFTADDRIVHPPLNICTVPLEKEDLIVSRDDCYKFIFKACFELTSKPAKLITCRNMLLLLLLLKMTRSPCKHEPIYKGLFKFMLLELGLE